MVASPVAVSVSTTLIRLEWKAIRDGEQNTTYTDKENSTKQSENKGILLQLLHLSLHFKGSGVRGREQVNKWTFFLSLSFSLSLPILQGWNCRGNGARHSFKMYVLGKCSPVSEPVHTAYSIHHAYCFFAFDRRTIEASNHPKRK